VSSPSPQGEPAKTVTEMTRAELEAVPEYAEWNREHECFALVIIPQRTRHDSGWRNISFVAIDRKLTPIARINAGTDVLHLDGIGGLGYRWERGRGIPEKVPPSGWQIDCLPTSGLLLLRPTAMGREWMKLGLAVSSFEIYAVPNTEGTR
jgi:hypothetical protein